MGNHKAKLVALLIVIICMGIWYWRSKPSMIGVAVNGVNHMGNGNGINEFYIDGGAFGNIGPDRGGGSSICCVLLPEVWRPGLQVELRWELADASMRKVVPFKAEVPVEKYDEPGDLVIHFFRDDYVRIVSSNYDVMSPRHPVDWWAADGGTLATKGHRISEIFTTDELAAFDKRYGR